MNIKYPWPASRLTAREMSLLYRVRARRGTPINELLRLAVKKAYPINERLRGDSSE